MSPCILVVEDEALVAADIQAVLRGFGYEVPKTASTNEEALRAVEQFHPDLILMDVRLKGGDDGVVTAATIRDRWPTPVVFLTSHADDATLSRAQGVEPFGYLLKPFNERELRATVQIALQRSFREESLRQQRGMLAGAVNGAQDAILAVDREGKVLFANDAALRADGEADARTHQSPWTTGSDGIRLPDRKTPCPPAGLPLVRALQGETVNDVDLFIEPHAGAQGCLYSVNAAPLRDGDGSVTGAVAIARDVTALRSNLSDLHELSATDDLTGAYNRRGFVEAASAKLKLAADAGRTPTLFFIDMNELKSINDTLGHAEGDRAIEDAVKLLRSTFRTSDVVARLGGDEFVVLANDAGAHSDVLRDRLKVAVDQFNEGAGREYRLSMSVGVAEYDPIAQTSLESLLGQADRRMYEAKALRASTDRSPPARGPAERSSR
jgi:diguanylate cyclase (GGDEF)-like protein